jgi:protein phosphatase
VIAIELNSFAISGAGLIREENQDNLYINGLYWRTISVGAIIRHGDIAQGKGLYAVADGMGGEKHGELASLVAVEALGKADFSRDKPFERYLLDRNAVICGLIQANGGTRIGSTFAGLHINVSSAKLANIGDSRIYLLREGELLQLSRDHTHIQQMIELGVLTKEAARTHRDRHKLSQHLGILPAEMIIEPYTASISISSGDVFLLCSDGLTDMLEDAEISEKLKNNTGVEHKAEALFSAAMKNGGKDNISIIAVQVK